MHDTPHSPVHSPPRSPVHSPVACHLADTGCVPVIDLNADLAESDLVRDEDLAMVGLVTSANLACGFHAGNRAVMRALAAACAERGVVVGAHVSYRDRDGFGRRPLDVTPVRLAADLVEQWETLVDEAAAAGAAVAYVKPHGALYHAMAGDPAVADVVVGSLAPHCPVLVAPPASAVEVPARDAGMRVVHEGFVDRGYDPAGHLVDRSEPGALIEDDASVADRARTLAVDHRIVAVDGTWVTLGVDTLCLHGDHAGAVARARAVRDALRVAGVTVTAFAGPR